MLKKLSLFLMFFSITIISVFTKSTYLSFERVSASEIVIGRYAYVEEVSRTQKVYISSSDVSFVESTGRQVFIESSGGGIPLPDPLSSDNSTNIIINPIIRRYYYYATPNSPKITRIVDIKNNLNSLIIMLQDLERRADEYGYIGTEKINAVLGYIRSLNSRYCDGYTLHGIEWSVVAGAQYTSFSLYTDNYSDRGIRPCDFFSSFILPGERNLSLRNQVNQNLQFVEFPDPYSESNLDLIHLFASIDGVYNDTCFLHLNLRDYYGERDVVSWNGDLQQAVVSLNNESDNNPFVFIQNFNDLMNFINSCSESDILSDIDAYNVAKSYLNLNVYDLSESLSIYYSDYDHKNYKRFNQFVHNCSFNYEMNISTRSGLFAFREKIFDSLAIAWNMNDTYEDVDLSVDEYVMYFVMRNSGENYETFGSNMPSFNVRYNIAQYFYEYIVENME